MFNVLSLQTLSTVSSTNTVGALSTASVRCGGNTGWSTFSWGCQSKVAL
jgi:hypothetical protein